MSGAARTRRGLGWKRWAREFNQYLAMLEFFFWPDRIIIGGGVSKESQRYWQYLSCQAELVKARYLNTSGIIGAAYAAALAAHEARQNTAPARASSGMTERQSSALASSGMTERQSSSPARKRG